MSREASLDKDPGRFFRRLFTSAETGRGSLLWSRHVTLAIAAIIVLVVGFSASSSIRYGLIYSTVLAILILGNNAVQVTLGEINLGSVAFLAFGAYVVLNFANAGIPPWIAVLLGIVLTAIVGFLLAIPTSRLTGLATALVTFALSYSIRDLAIFFTPLTGGDAGSFLKGGLDFFGMSGTGSEPGMLIVAVLAMIVAGLGHIWLLHRKPGRVALTVGEAPTAARVFGTPNMWVKLGVWTWAGALGGLAGGIYAYSVGFITAYSWSIMLAIFVFVGGLIGGTRSVVGAWIGGILVGGMPIWLTNVVPPTASTLVFGIILLVAVLAGGKGIAQFAERYGVRLFARVRGKR